MKSNKSNKKQAIEPTTDTPKKQSCCCGPELPDEQRKAMVAEAAYFRAEKRNFCGCDEQKRLDWLEAETEIEEKLSAQTATETAKSE